MSTQDFTQPWSGWTSGGYVGHYIRKYAHGQNRVEGEPNDNEHTFSWDHTDWRSTAFSERVNGYSVVVRTTWAFKPSPDYTHDTNGLAAKLVDKIHQSDFNAGVAAGEMGQTVRFIADAVRRIALSIREVKRGRFGLAINHLTGKGSVPDRLSDNWLQYKYALLPLLSDIKGAYDLLRRPYVRLPKVKASIVRGGSYSATSGPVTWAHTFRAAVEYRGTLLTDISLADRVGLTDPLSIAWELTKLSFVVDWLLPIGNFLTAVNARNALRWDGGLWLTRSMKQEWFNPRPNSSSVIWNPECSEDYCVRAYGDRYGVGNVLVRLPTLQNPLGLSYSQYLSAAALLQQVSRGR